MHRIDVLDAELEVNAATTRELERSGAEPAPRSGSFLDHQLDAVALDPAQVSDTLGVLLKYQDDIARLEGGKVKELLDQVQAELRAAE